MILYITKAGIQLNKRWWKFILYDNQEQAEKIIPIWLVDSIVLFSRVQLTTDVITVCLREQIPVFFINGNGKYLWKLDSLQIKNVELLYKHIWCALDEKCCLKYSKIFIKSKIYNSKVMLRRWLRYNWTAINIDGIISKLDNFLLEIDRTDNIDSLRAYEWWAAKVYYQWFAKFLPKDFVWTWRNRRPPKDPVNALLSLWYTLLAQTIQMYLEILGIDSQIWFMHKPKDLRSLLVLDMMEMFRSWVVDDLVLSILKYNKITKDDFIINRHSQTPVLLTEDGLRTFIWKYYKEVFKKSVDDNIMDGSNWVKLKYIEKIMEEFKKSFVDNECKYKWFNLK